MLFNSYLFILIFLPLVLLGYSACLRWVGRKGATVFLVLGSLVFYAQWNPVYLLLLLGSILLNYFFGAGLSKTRSKGALAVGVAINLGLLGYFKYSNFFVEQVHAFTGTTSHWDEVMLPLAISFFTFQQIAWLVDAQRGLSEEHDFADYVLFVSFFPQLIAGPIVHHAEMMPQFKAGARVNADHLARGITWFGIGLFKKTVIADSLSVYGSPVFKAVASGGEPTFFEAWGGALAYTGQIYFDFSGYSDMAIGLALLFGIRLPYNFASPYKAQNMIEFWRTWHMTLSRFLRDYLYFPLGGNRKGTGRRYLNLFITMVLGGIWHGAGWSFLVWGTLHGAYLVVNHGWRNLCRRWGRGEPGFFARGGYRALTFLAVVVGWVFFRTADLPTAGRMFEGMIGQHGWVLNDNLEPLFGFMKSWGVQFGATGSFNDDGIIPIVLALLLAFYAPNSQSIMDGTAKRLRWKMNLRWTLAVAALLLLAFMQLGTVSEFLYFQF